MERETLELPVDTFHCFYFKMKFVDDDDDELWYGWLVKGV